jgi:hypothetical protein
MICRGRGKAHMHIAVNEIKPGAKFGEHILYLVIIDERERCEILGMFHGAHLSCVMSRYACKDIRLPDYR